MNIANWDKTNNQLNMLYNKIFDGINIEKIGYYEKRKIIFEYLCNNIQYDYDLLEKIKLNQVNTNYKIPRQPYLEIESVLTNNKGICNAIAQVYKLLLEKVGIYSLCVICDDGTDVKHQLNLVYDEDNDSFSFDDITSIIVNRGSVDDFFDYDMEDANKNNQGNRVIYGKEYWVFLPTQYIYLLIGRKDEKYFKYNIEPSDVTKIPNNIISRKKSKKI